MLAVRELRFLQFGPFSFEVDRGRCLGVSGPSGSGKSLLLRSIADLDPHEGSISLRGAAAESMPAHHWRRRVAYLPSECAWWAERVGDHFALQSPHLAELGFAPDVLDREVRKLSSGEKQRLGLARLLLNDPEVLLLDEPTANLDPTSAGAVERILCALQADRTLVLVSHDQEQLQRLAHQRLELGSP